MLLEWIKKMAQKIATIAEEAQFEQDIVITKKYMRRLKTHPITMKHWENAIRNKRFKKTHPQQWAKQQQAIKRAQNNAHRLHQKMKDRMSHIEMDNRFQLIDGDDIQITDPKKDWLNEKEVPETEQHGGAKNNDNAHKKR